MPFFITVESDFSSAHRLPDHPGRCRNLHGHNWRVVVTVEAETLDGQGMVMDFSDLKKLVGDVCESLDHQNVNSIPPFDEIPPTAENLAHWIYGKIREGLALERVSVTSVKIWETDRNLCEYRP